MTPNSKSTPTGGDLAGIGIYFAAAVLLPLLGGVGLDKLFNTAPVFVLVGLGVGLVIGSLGLWFRVREFTK
jgi:F0F1-type ATP synthase assembly protein I